MHFLDTCIHESVVKCIYLLFFIAVSLVIRKYGSNMAGENYTLLCEARAGSKPNIMWSGPSGSIDESSISRGIILKETTKIPATNQYASVIVFAPLQASHAGEYTCEIPSLDSSSTNVIVNGVLTWQLSVEDPIKINGCMCSSLYCRVFCSSTTFTRWHSESWSKPHFHLYHLWNS